MTKIIQKQQQQQKTYQGNTSLVDKQEINLIKQKILHSKFIEDEFGDYLNLISHKMSNGLQI